MSSPRSYDESFGPIVRRARRMLRGVLWPLKGFLGLRRTILVEIRWRLGDEIMALPVYAVLQAAHPRDRVLLWCSYPELVDTSLGLVDESPGWVDRYISLRHASRDNYRLADYARRAGLRETLPRPKIDVSSWESPLQAELPRGSGPLAVLAPGASWATKGWPAERWRQLGGRLRDEGYRVVELGNEGESTGITPSFAGRSTVRDAAVILASGDLAVSCDSGLMHLALAVGTPTVSLFGPTVADVVVRDEPRFRALTNGRECRGCWNDSQSMTEPGLCPLGIDDCMGTIGVDEVMRAIATLEIDGGMPCASSF